MMPQPAELAATIDRAERIAEQYEGILMTCSPLHRRRLLAEAVIARLRDDRRPSWAPIPVPV